MADGQYFQYYLTLFSILFSILFNIIIENKYIFKKLTKVHSIQIPPFCRAEKFCPTFCD